MPGRLLHLGDALRQKVRRQHTAKHARRLFREGGRLAAHTLPKLHKNTAQDHDCENLEHAIPAFRHASREAPPKYPPKHLWIQSGKPVLRQRLNRLPHIRRPEQVGRVGVQFLQPGQIQSVQHLSHTRLQFLPYLLLTCRFFLLHRRGRAGTRK